MMRMGLRTQCNGLTAVVIGLAWIAMVSPGSGRAEYTYTDGSFGLALTLPDGTAVMRVTSPAGETGTEIGQLTLPDGNTVGRVVVSDLPENWTFAKASNLVRDQLAKDAKVESDQIVTGKVQVKGNYKSATLLEAWDEAHKLHNAILIVQGPSDQMLLLYIVTRDAKKDEARRITRKIVDGFDVLLQAKDEQKYQAAISKGSAMLMAIAAPVPSSESFWQNQYFLIQREKEAYGYIVVTEASQEINGRPGISMKSEKWVFWPAGGAEYEAQTAQATWDLHEDKWTSHSETVLDVPPVPPGQPQPPVKVVAFDQSVLRVGQQLFVETTDPKQPVDRRGSQKKVNREVPCPRNFMPVAWRWILPRLLLDRSQAGQKAGPASRAAASKGAAGEWLAVVTYSPTRRGLETEMLLRATHGPLRQVQRREGLYGDTETWQFDASGTVRQISVAGFRLVPTTKEEVDRLFASRIATWRGKVNPKKPSGS
jgi:hypothetical protein